MTFKVMSFNANGIRSAAQKGFFDWFAAESPDVLCVQETKAQEHQLTDGMFLPKGYKSYFFDAVKKGYSGVAIYTKHEPLSVDYGLGFELCDTEGRYIQANFDTFSVASLYLPSGTSGEERQACKYEFMARFEPILKQHLEQKRQIIICGDWNIAHKAIDLKNWRSNQTSSGFLPEERAWLDKLFHDWGFVDAFRVVDARAEQYTWWSHRGQARAKNVGWRIDYQVVTPSLKSVIESASIHPTPFFSDHAPLTVNYNLSIS